MSLTLYHYWRSSCSWRVRWAVNHKKLDCTLKSVNLMQNEQRSPAFLAINPAGTVPALMYQGKPMGESLAILEFLEEKFPNNPLLPSDPFSRFKVRQLCLTVVAGIQPIQNLKVQRYVSNDQNERNRFANYWIQDGLHTLERLLQETAGGFAFGGQLSLADICIVPQVYNALRFNVDMKQFPITWRIYERCMTLPDCIKASPEKQSDAPKA